MCFSPEISGDRNHSRKEVIHPLLPERIPCYDLVLIAELTLTPRSGASGTPDFAGLTGGVYKERERIHRGLLTRDYYRFRVHVGELQPTIPTEEAFKGLAPDYSLATRCHPHCRMCVALGISTVLTSRHPPLPPLLNRGSSV